MKRIKEIVTILCKYGYHYVIKETGFGKYVPFKKYQVKEADTSPEQVRHMFEELGGAFIKLGQLLALRPDLVGVSYSEEFEKLLNHIPEEDSETILKAIKGRPFTNFNTRPLGSASIAQVHKAQINGEQVAVKIKRPGIEQKFTEDIHIMESLARNIKEKFNPGFVDPVEVVEAFKDYTEKELDLQHEAANIKRFRRHFKESRHIKIPRVYEEFSDSNILVMEYITGHNILEKTKNKGLIKKITEAVYKMLFEDGFFHADLHAGNVFCDNKGRIIFLDFGIAGHVDRELERKLFNLFAALVEGNLDKTSESLLDLNIGSEEPKVRKLKDGLYNVLADYYDVSLGEMDFKKIFYGCVETARNSRIKFPAHLVLFGKSLVSMEGFCKQIDPGFNVVKNARPYVKKKLKKQLSIRQLKSGMKYTAFQLHDMLLEFPSSMKGLYRKFAKIEERIIDIDNTFRKLTKMLWRISKLVTLTLLFSTFFVSSIITLDMPPVFKGISVISWIGFSLSLLIFVSILRIFHTYHDL